MDLMSQATPPILYSFRRCPYAMRARLALLQVGIVVELREVLLKEKPQEMLEIAPKETVPVLQFPDGLVIDESLNIMRWAVGRFSRDGLNTPSNQDLDLIKSNDESFKHWLDRYKYHVGYPEHPMEYYRARALDYLHHLEAVLAASSEGSLSNSGPFADIAIFPFVRQFAHVDKDWFDTQTFEYLHPWLEKWLNSELFVGVMEKYPLWQTGEKGVEFGLGLENKN